MDKEMAWKKERLGRITASELGDLFSASGKIIDGNIDYVRHKRFERLRGFSYPVSAKNFEIGHEQEPYAIEWFRHNYPELPIIYAMELPRIPIWVADFANFSASPDAFTEDKSIVIEVKTVVSNGNAEFYADELTSYEDKLASVKKEHGMQIAGQFLINIRIITGSIDLTQRRIPVEKSKLQGKERKQDHQTDHHQKGKDCTYNVTNDFLFP